MHNGAKIMRTHQYCHIIEDLCNCHHLSPSEIFYELKKLYPKIGRATIYRNIEMMTRQGILRKIPSSCGKFYYERVGEIHAHLVDEKSKELQDFPLENLTIANLPEGYEVSEVCIYIRKKSV